MSNTMNLISRVFPGNVQEEAVWYDNCGADGLYFLDEGSFDGMPSDIKTMKAITAAADIPLMVCGKVRRFEDIKKMMYAGARTVIVREEDEVDPDEIREAVGRFGSDRLFLEVRMDTGSDDLEHLLDKARSETGEKGFGGLIIKGDLTVPAVSRMVDYLKVHLDKPVYGEIMTGDPEEIAAAAKMSVADGLVLDISRQVDMMEIKQVLKNHQIPVNTFESAVDFDRFKLNSDGMIPCITQDYKTGQVLMMAYMTKESFEKTIATGRMTYFSRSRQELWTKGDTSGHYQFVKSLSIDCDQDTILAKVAQVGAACHTGNRSCFFTDLVRKEADTRNPLEIFQDVYATIKDRKDHPKEGSYTNYLFDQGIDKILKKVGEEATEIVIAAKNPDSDELKYEICDFLYHMMVLMAQQDVTWKEITEELARRH